MDEHIVISHGKTIILDNDIEDRDTKNLTFWIDKHNWYSNKEAEEFVREYKGIQCKSNIKERLFGEQRERKRWFKNKIYYNVPLFVRPVLYFIYIYFIKFGFLDGKEGLIYHFLQAFWYRFLVDAKIYEYKKNDSRYKGTGELK